jgi:hypothetical protein
MKDFWACMWSTPFAMRALVARYRVWVVKNTELSSIRIALLF